MNKSSLIFSLLTFLVAASALKTPVLKKSFYLRDWDSTAYDIFRTKSAIISFSTVHPESHQVDPTYRTLGFAPSNVTEILRDITQDCDKDSYIYSRLTYYEKNDSLLYFCYNKKSLLVLDSTRFTVQKSIPLSFDFPFLEMAKLYPENDSLVILLVKTLKNPKYIFNSTVFLRVNLTTQQVTQNFVLDRGFGAKESVVAYAGNGTTSYLLTNNYNESIKNVAVYAFNSSSNSYNVSSSLYNETFNLSIPLGYIDIFTELYVAGDLVMTSNNDSILFFNSQGRLISKELNLTLQTIDFGGWRRTPAFFEGRNKTFYFESNQAIIQLTVQGTSIKTKVIIVSGTYLQVARGNSQQGDQIFYLRYGTLDDDSYWFVLDVETSKILSQVPMTYNNIFTTDDTYAFLNNMVISVFGWNNETFLGKIKIEQNGARNDEYYYYDTENSYFYYLRYPNTPDKCDLVQIDIRTGASRNISSLNGISLCTGRITQINSTSLDFVIEDIWGGYYVNSARFGQANFTYIFSPVLRGFAAFNFDDLSTHLIHYSLPSFGWNHSFFTFDNRSRSFTVQNSSKVMGFDLYLRVFRYFGGQKIFVSENEIFNSLDLTTNVVTKWNVPYRSSVPTHLFGNNGDEGFIITGPQVFSGIPYYYNPNDVNQFGSLPTEQPLALNARASGRCKYFQANGYFLSETVIDFYDFCASSENVPSARKFLRGIHA